MQGCTLEANYTPPPTGCGDRMRSKTAATGSGGGDVPSACVGKYPASKRGEGKFTIFGEYPAGRQRPRPESEMGACGDYPAEK